MTELALVKPGGKGQVQSLARAFGLLETVAEAGVGLGLSHIAARMGLAPSTTHRLLNSMRDLGYVENDPATGLWSVGLQAFRVGNAYLHKRDFVSQARPFMKKLVAEVGETVNMAILDQDNVVFIAQVECAEVMRMAVPIGRRGPLHASAVGKAILATLTTGEARDIMGRIDFTALTVKTHCNRAALTADLAGVRRRGYALDEEEQSLGMRCIAASIFDEHQDAIAAISISGPTVRLTDSDIESVGQAVMTAAADITRSIGGQQKK